jgi:hypothetical protein
MDFMRTPSRKLDAIADELVVAMKAESANFISIGSLLIEAQGQLEHGQFVSWLEVHFEKSVSTAYNYIAAARIADEFPTVGNLRLRPGALYALGQSTLSDDQALMDAIFKEAETTWVDGRRVGEMWREIMSERAASAAMSIVERASDGDDDAEETRKEREKDEARWRYQGELEKEAAAIGRSPAHPASASLTRTKSGYSFAFSKNTPQGDRPETSAPT